MTGPLSEKKQKIFMQAYINRRVRSWVFALIFLAAITPVQAAPNPIRALHFMVFNLSVDDAKRLIDEASKGKFNTIILGMPWGNGLKLRSTPWVVPTKLTWQRDDLLDVVNYARLKKMDVIPQMPLLSHQELLLAKNFPDLMFNSKTYDPRKEKVFEIVLPIIDELVELLHPKAIHIGHDEVVGWTEEHYTRGLLKPGEQILPPDLFLANVNRLHAYLKKNNIETWMWGDMLLAPKDFPTIRVRGDLNGNSPGYGQALRRKIPKDIVICDWHYLNGRYIVEQTDFPTLAAFKSDGFRVLGTTWREKDTTVNFSKYAVSNGADGMIASTWIILGEKSNKVVNNWSDIEQIIHESGNAFKNDFPDAK
jgi:hypothetical protein